MVPGDQVAQYPARDAEAFTRERRACGGVGRFAESFTGDMGVCLKAACQPYVTLKAFPVFAQVMPQPSKVPPILPAEWARVTSRQRGDASEVIRQVIEDFRSGVTRLVAHGNALHTQNQAVGDEISEVLVALQFQDRVSQMLGHMRDDIEKLGLRLGETTQHIDARDWLDDLSHTYTTPEQHAIHHGRSTPAASSAADITFF